jgi:signal transduction histidine kinase
MASSKDTMLNELEDELHELCQPLTALHFRLEVGKADGGERALHEAVEGALDETARMVHAVRRMRERVSAMRSADRAEETL